MFVIRRGNIHFPYWLERDQIIPACHIRAVSGRILSSTVIIFKANDMHQSSLSLWSNCMHVHLSVTLQLEAGENTSVVQVMFHYDTLLRGEARSDNLISLWWASHQAVGSWPWCGGHIIGWFWPLTPVTEHWNDDSWPGFNPRGLSGLIISHLWALKMPGVRRCWQVTVTTGVKVIVANVERACLRWLVKGW